MHAFRPPGLVGEHHLTVLASVPESVRTMYYSKILDPEQAP